MAVAHYNCDYCNNMVYDEETEQFVCDVDMDEDDYARLLTSEYKECPYYQSNDEYKIVRHQMLVYINIINSGRYFDIFIIKICLEGSE